MCNQSYERTKLPKPTTTTTTTMKSTIAILSLTGALVFTGLTALAQYKRAETFRDQLLEIVHNRTVLTDKVTAEKVEVMQKMADNLKKKFGDIDDLGTMKMWCTPKAIQGRWSDHLKGSPTDRDIYLEADIDNAIVDLLFTEELLKDDVPSPNQRYRDIVQLKTTDQEQAAIRAAYEQRDEIVAPFQKRINDIMNRTRE